jgi:hypothetical protein
MRNADLVVVGPHTCPLVPQCDTIMCGCSAPRDLWPPALLDAITIRYHEINGFVPWPWPRFVT